MWGGGHSKQGIFLEPDSTNRRLGASGASGRPHHMAEGTVYPKGEEWGPESTRVLPGPSFLAHHTAEPGPSRKIGHLKEGALKLGPLMPGAGSGWRWLGVALACVKRGWQGKRGSQLPGAEESDLEDRSIRLGVR